jgi:hypothetical protein
MVSRVESHADARSRPSLSKHRTGKTKTGISLLQLAFRAYTMAREMLLVKPRTAAKGSCAMRNRQEYRCDRHDLSDFDFRKSGHRTDFITVHTFGGRGSPLF